MRGLLRLVVIVAILVAAAVTNPSSQKHDEAVSQKMAQVGGNEAGVVGRIVQGAATELAATDKSYTNLLVASMGRRTVLGRSVSSFGLFGNVFVSVGDSR